MARNKFLLANRDKEVNDELFGELMEKGLDIKHIVHEEHIGGSGQQTFIDVNGTSLQYNGKQLAETSYKKEYPFYPSTMLINREALSALPENIIGEKEIQQTGYEQVKDYELNKQIYINLPKYYPDLENIAEEALRRAVADPKEKKWVFDNMVAAIPNDIMKNIFKKAFVERMQTTTPSPIVQSESIVSQGNMVRNIEPEIKR